MPKAGQPVAQCAVRFGDFEFQPDEAALFRRGHRLKLQSQPYRLLAYFISRAPSIVNRDELGEHIWGDGVHVDMDQSLNYCVRQIRQVLDDDAIRPRFVERLPRQGYRFICPVEVILPPMTAALPQQNGRPVDSERLRRSRLLAHSVRAEYRGSRGGCGRLVARRS